MKIGESFTYNNYNWKVVKIMGKYIVCRNTSLSFSKKHIEKSKTLEEWQSVIQELKVL